MLQPDQSFTRLGRQPAPKPDLYQEVQEIFRTSRRERFEGGPPADFTRGLARIIERYGEAVLPALKIVLDEWVSYPGLVGEALRWLGYLNHSPTYERRRWLLVCILLSDASSLIKAEAALGVASLNDPWAIPYVEAAVRREPVDRIRRVMQAILDQLRAAQSGQRTARVSQRGDAPTGWGELMAVPSPQLARLPRLHPGLSGTGGL